ncbi:MPS1 [Candida margitis]|uniref:MPS1 n=1 Tax=Candida margitis TaxID=1775924 RepID=UPI002226E533|nr:MPS1 [Candida margitis]KAI5970906.1 MPS1 [Candida margitis]
MPYDALHLKSSNRSMVEDDNTCAPPPSLSSYSIEMLNAKRRTNNSPVTGIYHQDFPDRSTELRKKFIAVFGHTTTTTENSLSDGLMEDKSGSTSKSTLTGTENRLKRRRYGKVLGAPKRASQNNTLEDDYIDEELIKKNVEERKEVNKSPAKRQPLSDISNVFRKPVTPKKDLAEAPAPVSVSVQAPTPIAPVVPVAAMPPITASKAAPPLPTTSDPEEPHDSKRIFIVNNKKYEKLELLGRGGSSKVYRIKAANGHQFALKKVTLNQTEDISSFKGEIELLRKLRNYKRVVKLYDSEVTRSSIYLIMEKGDIDLALLFQNRLNMNLPLDLQFVRYHMSEMFKCVKDVHDAGVVHSDLKPANFLMVRGILKIIDFGIANAVPDHTANIYRESQIGTPNYMAPEALEEASMIEAKNTTWRVGRPSDIWSCGCIMYQFIYGRPPYASLAGTKRILAIMNPQYKIQYPQFGIGDVPVPQSAINLMQNCLAREPDERWTVEQCLNSDFFHPKAVDENFITKIVHQSVNLGYNKRISGEGITTEAYDSMVNDIIEQIRTYNC